MPSLKLTKEDVEKQIANFREEVITNVDRRIDEIKSDVETVTQVRAQGVPQHADGVISVVKNIELREGQWRKVDYVQISIGSNQFSDNIPPIELPAGRYRVFISVHKVPE